MSERRDVETFGAIAATVGAVARGMLRRAELGRGGELGRGADRGRVRAPSTQARCTMSTVERCELRHGRAPGGGIGHSRGRRRRRPRAELELLRSAVAPPPPPGAELE